MSALTDGITHKIIKGEGTYAGGQVILSEPIELTGVRFDSPSKFVDGEMVVATFRYNASLKKIFPLSVRSKILVAPSIGTTTTGAVVGAETAAPPIVAPLPEPLKIEEPLKSKKNVGNFYIDSITRKALNAVHNIARKTGYCNVTFVGPSGYGKTTLAKKFAQASGRGFVRINCAVVRDPEEWFGYREAKDGSTVFEPTIFTNALTKGNMVILLDEVNRLEPWLLNSLFPLLDDDKETDVHGNVVKVAPNTVFMMTMNQGAQYTGIFQLDEAFSNRSDFVIKVGPMPIDDEKLVLKTAFGIDDLDVAKIITTINDLRRLDLPADCSTRASLNIAKQVLGGLSVREAFEFVIVNRLADKSDNKKAVDIINSRCGTLM